MEQVLEWIAIVLRVLLASMIALTPGMLVWLAVVSVFVAVRHLVGSSLFQRLRHGGTGA